MHVSCMTYFFDVHSC